MSLLVVNGVSYEVNIVVGTCLFCRLPWQYTRFLNPIPPSGEQLLGHDHPECPGYQQTELEGFLDLHQVQR